MPDVTRAIETALIRPVARTRQRGTRGGIVTLVQRWRSALNLNVHLRMLVLDDIYANVTNTPPEETEIGRTKRIQKTHRRRVPRVC